MTDSEVRLAEIRQRHAAIDSPPWHFDVEGGVWTNETGALIASSYREADGRFIAHAPEDIQWLLLAVDRLQANSRMWMQQVNQLKDHLRELEWAGDKHGDPSCPACDAFRAFGEKDPHPGWGEHDPKCWLWLALREA